MAELEKKELKIIYNLFRWEKFNKTSEILIYNFMLFIGGLLIVLTVFKTLTNLTDKSILYITLPGFLAGILFIWVYLTARKRIQEKSEFTRIFHKLLEDEKQDLDL
ncbi:MAG: hypothetical protein APR54_03735 [Candidatus Cloacimonas sp. SDB]|nr:MAG: hypothetical protein APR54_03735 [Candidatus Cloacimonas sp. SDB]